MTDRHDQTDDQQPTAPAEGADAAVSPNPADQGAEDLEPTAEVDGATGAGGDEEHGVDLEAAAAADPRTRAEMLSELVEAEAKRDEYLDDLRRSHADFENYRKRVVRERAAQQVAGKAAVAESLLEALDDLDRTVAAAGNSSDDGLARGVQLVADKLAKALAQVGLQRVDDTGVAFDPEQHEAVQQQAADPPRDEPVVAEVLRPGYRIDDRTLRAAMVVVEQ